MFELAHTGHWVEGIAFASPAILIPLAIVFIVWHERRRERRSPEAA